METRLIIWEPTVIEGKENFYLAQDIEGFPLPQVGDVITMKRSHKQEWPDHPHREKDYPVRAKYKVTGREYVIHEKAHGQYESMVCELTIERFGDVMHLCPDSECGRCSWHPAEDSRPRRCTCGNRMVPQQ